MMIMIIMRGQLAEARLNGKQLVDGWMDGRMGELICWEVACFSVVICAKCVHKDKLLAGLIGVTGARAVTKVVQLELCTDIGRVEWITIIA